MATESDNVNSGALGTLLAVGACATLGIALVVTALVRSETNEEMENKELGADRPFRDLVAEQTAKMAAPAAYVDRGRGLISLPIERAMELTVSGLIKDPNSATPPPPPNEGGTGGSGAAADAGALGGTGGGAPDAARAGGSAASAGADSAAVQVAKPAAGSKAPAGGEKPEKKAAPKPAKPVPAAPAAPAPNGQ
jgi:hypothetical protein